MANMRRPLRSSDAILGHVASWGDRFPMSGGKSREPVLSIASRPGSPFRDCELRLLCPSPRNLAARGLVTEERRAKHRGDQIVQ